MKGFLVQSDALLWIAVALLSNLLMLSLVAGVMESSLDGLVWAQKTHGAHALSDAIAKRLVSQDGSIRLDALEQMQIGRAQVRLGDRSFGAFPPENESVSFFRRLAFVEGRPEILEVRAW